MLRAFEIPMLAMDLGFLDVHVQAEAAAVHLRRADVYQAKRGALDGTGFQESAEIDEFLEQFGRLLEGIDALGHAIASFGKGLSGTSGRSGAAWRLTMGPS